MRSTAINDSISSYRWPGLSSTLNWPSVNYPHQNFVQYTFPLFNSQMASIKSYWHTWPYIIVQMINQTHTENFTTLPNCRLQSCMRRSIGTLLPMLAEDTTWTSTQGGSAFLLRLSFFEDYLKQSNQTMPWLLFLVLRFCKWSADLLLESLREMLFVVMLLLICITESHCFRYHGYAYDGIWTIARAIDRVEEESQQANESLVDFNYK